MKKAMGILLLGVLAMGMIGCSKSKQMTLPNGTSHTVQPYGIIDLAFNKDKIRHDVSYKLSVNDIILSVIFSETIVIPIVSLGFYLWEPDGLK